MAAEEWIHRAAVARGAAGCNSPGRRPEANHLCQSALHRPGGSVRCLGRLLHCCQGRPLGHIQDCAPDRPGTSASFVALLGTCTTGSLSLSIAIAELLPLSPYTVASKRNSKYYANLRPRKTHLQDFCQVIRALSRHARPVVLATQATLPCSAAARNVTQGFLVLGDHLLF